MPDLHVVSDQGPTQDGTGLPRLRKDARREQILLELKLRPHVRIADLAERFGVSGETIRRDFEALSGDGLLARAHGGASAPAHGHYPGLNERSAARIEERERIGRRAAELVRPGETLMIDAGSTTMQFARFLAWRGTPCTVVTNSLHVAMTLGQSGGQSGGSDGGAQVILCPGDYLPAEAAVVGADAIEFIERHNVDRCMIGASGLSATGPSEAVRGFAAIKRAMLGRSAVSHLLIDGEKFGKQGLASVGGLGGIASVVVDTEPRGTLREALAQAGVEVLLAT